jgi:hypothetical protein
MISEELKISVLFVFWIAVFFLIAWGCITGDRDDDTTD